MTGQELIDLLVQITDEEHDEEDALRLLNWAKDKIEGSKEWHFLTIRDATLTWAVSDTYETEKTIPSTMLTVYSVTPSSYYTPFDPIPFEDIQRWRDLSGMYTIDELNRKLRMMGTTGEARTLTLIGNKKTDDLTTSNSPTWPSRYHRIIAIEAACIFLGIDSDDVNINIGTLTGAQLREMKSDMNAWDVNNKLRAMNYSTLGRNSNSTGQNRIDTE